jgi:hypothetical protein
MNRVLNNTEAKAYTDKGMDLRSNTNINYQFSVVVNAKRLELFEITFNKFLNDGLTYVDGVSTKHAIQVECIKNLDDDYYKVSRRNTSNPFYLQKKNDIYVRTEEDVLFHSVLHKRIQFDFIGCHPLVVIKVVTDLKDVVDFIDRSYVYDLDGTEILRHKYPIGSILMYQKRLDYGISTTEFKKQPESRQVTVLAYDYDRNLHRVSYIVHYEPGDEMSGFNFNAFEEELSVSRDINLDSLLDN